MTIQAKECKEKGRLGHIIKQCKGNPKHVINDILSIQNLKLELCCCWLWLLEVAKLSKIKREDVFMVAIQQFLGNNEIGSFTGMVRIPKHMPWSLCAQAWLRPAWYYTCKLPSIPTTRSTSRLEPYKYIVLFAISRHPKHFKK